MRPRRPLALTGCAALAALALATSGCGGEAPASPEKAAAKPQRTTSGAAQATAGTPGRCRAQLGSFVDSLDSLRRRLATGLTYAQYSSRVAGLRSAYAAIPVSRLAPPCLVAVGTPSERAFDVYLGAANTWGGCLAEPGCSAADVETTLQSEWHRAVRPLAEARVGLLRGGA
jgi:hypothetical protein